MVSHNLDLPAGAIPGSVWAERATDLRRHLDDLRSDTYNGAVSRADRDVVFERAFGYLTPVATHVLLDLSDSLLRGSGVVTIRRPAPMEMGDPNGSFGWWSLSWPILERRRNRFDGHPLDPVRIGAIFPRGWTHGHLVAGASMSKDYPEVAWPLQIDSEAQVARYEPVLRLIAEAELHDRILQGTHKVIP